MTKRLSVNDAIARLREAAIEFARAGPSGEIPLMRAAMQYASAKRRRRNSRDAWKLKHRID